MTEVVFREPTVEDAFSMWNLVKINKPLDENSRYLYVLLCHQFSKTCVVGVADSKIVAFVSGFISPKKPDTLFIWQAAVSENFRNKGIAQKLISKALSQTGPSTRYVEATVTPSNIASLKFLKNFANKLNVNFTKKPLFTKSLVGENHEPEDLVRIGPIPSTVEEIVV